MNINDINYNREYSIDTDKFLNAVNVCFDNEIVHIEWKDGKEAEAFQELADKIKAMKNA